MPRIDLCSTADVAPGSAIKVETGDLSLAVYNIDGEFYVTDDECTHAAASLADGMLEGETIECALHFGAFNVKTGEAVQAPCFTPLRTYKVAVRGDNVYVDLEKEAGD